MAAIQVVALLLALFAGVKCQYGQYNNDYYNNNNYNNYPPYNQYNTERPGQDPILWRAHERTKFEAQLKVSCDTGDDRACFELFLSVHRMALYFTAAILLALILLGICVGVCCYCKRKRHRRSTVID